MQFSLNSIVVKPSAPRKSKESTESSVPEFTIFQTPEEGSRKEYQFGFNAAALNLLGINPEAEPLPHISFIDGDRETDPIYHGRLWVAVFNPETQADLASNFPQLRKNGKFSNKDLHIFVNTKSWINTERTDKVFTLEYTPNDNGLIVAEVRPVGPEVAVNDARSEEVPQDIDTRAQEMEDAQAQWV